MLPQIVVDRDCEGFFERTVREWYQRLIFKGIDPKRKLVIVTCNDEAPNQITAVLSKHGDTLVLTFRTDVRLGTGEVTTEDIYTSMEDFL